MLHAGTSSTSDLSINSGSESDGLVSCLPALSMSTTARGKECKAREALKRTVKLTEPGPQFLVFLERYGWEVEARWDVYVKQLLAKVKEEDEDEEEEEGIQVMVEEKDANLKAFEFMVGNYCVRRFLEDAGRELTSFSELSQSKMTQPRTFKERMRKMFKKSCEKEVKEKKKVETSSRPSPPRMFGEIEKSPTTAVVEKDTWVKGLLWYHGFKSGTTTSLAIDDPVIGSTKVRVLYLGLLSC